MFLAFRICARPIISEKGKDIFLWCSALQVFGQCGGASMRTRQSGKHISGEKDFRFASADFPPAERGLGNECGRVLRFGFRRASFYKIITFPSKQFMFTTMPLSNTLVAFSKVITGRPYSRAIIAAC